jgi:hypothetical protein
MTTQFFTRFYYYDHHAPTFYLFIVADAVCVFAVFLIQQQTPIDCRRPSIHWRWSYSGWITYYHVDTHGTLALNSPQVLIPIIGCCVQFLDNHQSFPFLPFSLFVRQVFFLITAIELARVYHPFIFLFIFEIFASCWKCRHTHTHTSCDFLLMGGGGDRARKIFKGFLCPVCTHKF